MAGITSMSSRNFRLTTTFVCFGILIFAFLHLHTFKDSTWHLSPNSVNANDVIAGTEEYVPIVYETPESPETSESTKQDEYKSILAEVDIEEEEEGMEEEEDTFNKLTAKSSKVAVIIEDRKLNTLPALILHFAAVLGPTWDVILYTSPENAKHYSKMSSLVRWKDQIHVRALPEENMFTSHESVSAFLTKPWIWEALAPADHVFMFQADSIICANSERKVDDFLGYDFIGAPVREGLGRGFNGGFSIRNRKKLLSITVNYDWLEERHIWGTGDGYNYQYEDQWFAMRLSHMPGATLPDEQAAGLFSVETIWYEKSLGYHQVARWLPEHLNEAAMWCPEVALCKGAAYV